MDYGERRENRFGGRSNGGGSRFGGGGRSGGFSGGRSGGGGFSGPRGSSFSPVKEGEEINAVIEAVAEKGDGIAKKAGFVIFVPGTKVGDKVKIKVKKVAKKVAFAEVIGAYEEGAAETTSAPVAEGNEEISEVVEEEKEAEEEYDATQDSEEF